ncbi:hypothetical protein WJX73_007459 [Symbiochloris irregularis]
MSALSSGVLEQGLAAESVHYGYAQQLQEFDSIVGMLVSIRDAEMRALSTAIKQLQSANWCSEAQYS